MRRFARLELPDYRTKEFEDFMLKGIDFKTKKTIKLKEPENYIVAGNERYFYGFYEKALKCYARALKENQKRPDAWIGEIRTLVDIGRFDAAIYWAEKGLRLFPKNEGLELAMAFALAHSGGIESAKKLINKPVKKKDTPIFWLFRGEVLIKIKLNFLQKLTKPYRNIGKIGAFFCFVKALESDPKDGFINQRIGIAYLLANDITHAYDYLRTALITAPQNSLTLYCLVECSHKMHDYQHLLYYTKKAIAFNPHLDAAIELLQWFYSPYGRFVRKMRKTI